MIQNFKTPDYGITIISLPVSRLLKKESWP